MLPEEERIDGEKVKKRKNHNNHFKNAGFTKKILKNTDKVQIGEIIMRMIRKEMCAHARMNAGKGGQQGLPKVHQV